MAGRYRVISAAPYWTLNGVNIFSANLVRGLNQAGVPAHVLITGENPADTKPMNTPPGLSVERLPTLAGQGLKPRWRAMINHLEDRAPCIYIPNHDYEHSCVVPRLSEKVGVVGIAHSDDPEHYAHVQALGKYWNVIVAVSAEIAAQLQERFVGLADRVHVITYGVEIPESAPIRDRAPGSPIKLVYAGRLVQHQKRVFDLHAIARGLSEQGVPFQLTIIGGGPQSSELQKMCSELVGEGRVEFKGIVSNQEVLEEFSRHDVFLMTSSFEGMPLVLIEALGRGLIPVVTEIRSGVRELVREGENGFMVPVGDIRAFIERIGLLQKDLELCRRSSGAAFKKVDASGFRIEDMTLKYLKLFDRVMEDAASGKFRRPRGRVVLPRFVRKSWKDRLPGPVRTLGRKVKSLFRSHSN